MKRIKVLVLVLAFTLAAIGGAYACWYDSLFVNETVGTGVVDLQWTCRESSDPSPNYESFTCTNDRVYQGNLDRLDDNNPNDCKNVGYKDAVFANDTEELPAICGTDNRMLHDVLQVTLHNGYPGYQEYIHAQISNVGSVPIKFVDVVGTSVPDWMHVQILGKDDAVLYDSKDASKDGIDGIQLDPDDCMCVKVVERVLQSAPQNASDTFSLKLKGIQWNEHNFNLPNGITAGEGKTCNPTTPCNS